MAGELKQLGLFDPPSGRKDPLALQYFGRGRWFTAKKKGACNSCGERLSVGDKIWIVPYHSFICVGCALIYHAKIK